MARGRKKKTDQAIILRLPEDVDSELIGMSREFAKAQLVQTGLLQWSNVQRRLFAITLGGIDWRKGGNNNVIELRYEDVARKLGWELDDKNLRNMRKFMKDEILFMSEHSNIQIHDANGNWETYNLIEAATGNDITGTHLTVTINPKLMPHFERLYEQTKDGNFSFVTLLEPDILSFKTAFAYPLFMELKTCSRDGGAVNTHTLSTKKLKEIFGLDESAYMREQDKESGKYNGFDRYNFEKRVLNRAIEDINNSEMIEIMLWEKDKSYPYEVKNYANPMETIKKRIKGDGNYFGKIKERGKVVDYVFKYKVLDKNGIAKKRQEALNKYLEAKKEETPKYIYENFYEVMEDGTEVPFEELE